MSQESSKVIITGLSVTNSHPQTSMLDNNPEKIEKKSFLREESRISSFLAYLGACMMTICSLVFINMNQVWIIENISYPSEKVGDAVGSLALAHEIVCILLGPLWGIIFDFWISKPLGFSFGLGLMGTAIFLHPWATSVFPSINGESNPLRSLFFFRLIFGAGASAATVCMTSCMNDYSRPESRSRVAGIVGLSSGLGAMIAAMLLSRAHTVLGFSSSKEPRSILIPFMTTASLLIITAIFAALFMQKFKTTNRESKVQLFHEIISGFGAMRNPYIVLAYASGFVARAYSIVLPLYITPWIKRQQLRKSTLTYSAEILKSIKDPGSEARRISSMLSGTNHLAMLVGAPFFGILFDRLRSSGGLTVMIPSILGTFSFSVLTFTESTPSIVIMILTGLSDIGMIIASMALLSSLCPLKSQGTHRGAISGVYSLFGSLGIIFASKIGGLLFDHIRESFAFLPTAIISAILFLYSIVLIGLKVSLVPVDSASKKKLSSAC